jgi:cytochrome c oxidase cbb3-type subunit 3
VDENTVTMADADGLGDGKTIYTINCSPCHGQHGEGVVGPNLTDDYWLHGGSLSNVFKSIKTGWPAMGMKPWENDLTPVQIKNVASYIKTLRGTNPPNAKAPQGDLYLEPGEKPLQSSTGSIKSKTL